MPRSRKVRWRYPFYIDKLMRVVHEFIYTFVEYTKSCKMHQVSKMEGRTENKEGRLVCRDQGSRNLRRGAILVTAVDKNFYQILDIPKDADSKTIKKAFKKMALKYHPDVNKEVRPCYCLATFPITPPTLYREAIYDLDQTFRYRQYPGSFLNSQTEFRDYFYITGRLSED